MKQKNIVILLLLAILIVGAGIRFYHLDKESLWTDEMVTMSHLDGNLFQSLINKELMPPGYFLLLKPVVATFGQSEFSLRFLSALFDTLSILLVYLVGKRWFNKKVGILSAILLATTMLQVVYAQEARPYSLFGFLVLLTTYLFILAKDDKRFWPVYILVAAISLYTNYLTLFVILIHIILTIFYFKSNIKKNLISILMVFLLFLPGMPMLYQQVLLRQASLTKNLVLRGVPQILGQLGVGFYLLPLTLLTVFLVAVFILLRKVKKLSRKNTVSFTLITITITLIAQIIFLDTTLRSFALVRHSFFVVPFAYILISKGITRIKPKKMGIAVVGIVLIFNLITLAVYYSETTKTPWNQAVNLIESQSDNPLVLFDRYGSNLMLYQYYQTEEARLVSQVNLKDLQVVLKDDQEFWFISSRNFDRDIYKDFLEENYKLVSVYNWTEMAVYKFKA